MTKKALPFFLIALAIIVLDQTSKLLVYYNMDLNTEFNVIGQWFRIHYLLNPGMAFGLKWESEYGKLALTVFRLVAMVGIGYYLFVLVKRNSHRGLLISMGLILGGAVGNVIDSTFYGVFLNNALPGSPTPWFHGQVIDMLYFPMINGRYPEWIPFLGGDRYQFFSPVFNVADSSIFIGVVIILIFQKRFFPPKKNSQENEVQPLESMAPGEPIPDAQALEPGSTPMTPEPEDRKDSGK